MDFRHLLGSFGATVGGTGENLYFETVPNETGTANLGITVHGSVNDTNLLQGSSGPIYLDHAASVYPVGEDYSYNDAYYGAVGNDTLSGGPFDDNYFPEGGNDTIYLAHASGGSASTIWFGFYDVGYSGQFEDGSGPGAIFEQAITDKEQQWTHRVPSVASSSWMATHLSSPSTASPGEPKET